MKRAELAEHELEVPDERFASAKRELKAMGEVLEALEKCPDDETRRRAFAAAAILTGVVSPDVVLQALENLR